MTTLLIIVHILVCLFLIFIVLIQGGKGADIGASFGGGSQTLFGGRGSSTFLGKLTTTMAIVFMFSSLLLTLASTKSTSIIQDTPGAPMQQQETAPAAPPQGMPAGPVTPAAPAGK